MVRNIRTGAMRTLVSGDTLSAIAMNKYGAFKYAADLWKINLQVIGNNANLIIAGRQINVPDSVSELVSLSGLTNAQRDALWSDIVNNQPYPSEMTNAEMIAAQQDTSGANIDAVISQAGMFTTKNIIIASLAFGAIATLYVLYTKKKKA